MVEMLEAANLVSNYALLWRQVILLKCKFIHVTFLLKSIPTAFSRMSKNGEKTFLELPLPMSQAHFP